MLRVVSLVPSVTETLVNWGVVPVACTRFCEQPELRAVGGTKNPDVAAITKLAPDVVVTEREENRPEDVDALRANGVAVSELHIRSVDDVVPQMTLLAEAVGVSTNLAEACAPAAPDGPLAAVPLVTGPTGGPVRAFIPIWQRPYMTLNASTYGTTLLATLGIESAFADHPDTYPTVTDDELAAAEVDIVLVPTEPYPYKAEHLSRFCHIAPAMLIDGVDLFWWGWRTPAAVDRLARTLERAPF